VFGVIRYNFNLNMIGMRMGGQINGFRTYCFGCAVIQIAELNIETKNSEMENVMQLMV